VTESNRRTRDGDPFYEDLGSFDNFADVSNLSLYTPAPDDWYVVIADIKGSTAAITEGRYKDVNMVGAACITAILNATRAHEIPYVFGGDGATLMVPAESLERVKLALLKTKNLAQSRFGLSLRIGAVPVSKVRRGGIDVLVGKFCLSPGNYLAVFTGGGVGLIDKLIKEDDGTQGYAMTEELEDDTPDLEGLSCRWEPLMAQRGVMLSILVQALAESRSEAAATYGEVIKGLTEALGFDPQKNRPVKSENMKFSWPPKGLKAEAQSTHGGKGYRRRLFYLYLESLFQWTLDRFNLKAGSYNAPVYRQEMRENSDYRRFDDTLRMLLDCSPDEVAALEKALSQFRDRGLIAYGLHRADSALMTCMVFSLAESEHVHFIDGGDGGFAMAARQLKEQLADGKDIRPGIEFPKLPNG
jgi:hypothetical protein